jgi:glycosyltransferase involved in cell wall biosynthesis
MVLFLAAAIPLGLAWARPGAKVMAVQLMSTSVAAGICSFLRRRPFVALSTTSGSLSETDYIRSASFSGLRQRLLARASLVAQTPEVAAILQEAFPESKVAVLPNPVEPVDLPPPLNRRPLAFFAGRFSEEKDLPCLLEAWAEVAPGFEGARLVLVGEGGAFRSVEADLRREVSTDPVLRTSTEFTGWVADLKPYFSDIDVFVLPSVSEGMSNVLLEACAWNRVVVASDIPSNRAVLGPDYPLLFTPSDPRSLADALRQALSLSPDNELEKKVLASVRRAATRSSPDEVLPRLEQMLDAADSARN